jgi:hypothetical protein
MMNQNPTKELQINFPISQVKEKIEAVITAGKSWGYKCLDKNDAFNTYRIAIDIEIILNVTLTEIDENKIQWKSEIMNASGRNSQPDVLSRLQDDFLNTLSKGLMGEDITIELVDQLQLSAISRDLDLLKANKSGCLGMIVLFVSVSTLITSFFL